jgi:hypothetical protein
MMAVDHQAGDEAVNNNAFGQHSASTHFRGDLKPVKGNENSEEIQPFRWRGYFRRD